MPVHLHRAPRTDALADGLARLLATPLADPFASELVVVPAKGVERWLSQRLSMSLGAAEGRTDGVCAGVEFVTPWSLFAEIAGTREEDPWAPDVLVWPLLAVIDAVLDEAWASTLARHLGHRVDGEEGEQRRSRRFAVARRLAGLFSSYSSQRPSVVREWSAGGSSVPPDLAWQPELWRRLCAAVDSPPPHERQAEVLGRLRSAPETVDLPPRLSLFGHTRLPVTEVELLAGLGEHRDVHVWLPHPSEVLWSRLEGLGGPVRRSEDRSHEEVGHPLLASLGRDVRELQRTLSTIEVVDTAEPAAVEPVETLLGWLQEDIRANATTVPRALAPGDRSIQVHACHGPARQVEVLREVLLGLLADDPTLEPRDVLVMCPDIEGYAPLISANFGLAEVVGPAGHPAHQLRVKLADRALTQTNPLLEVGSRLLDLAGGRMGVGEVLDLAHLEPVRRRFGLRDDDLEQLGEWAQETAIRWGLDAAHRSDFGLERYPNNTWEFGIDRLLAGVAISDDAHTWLDRTLPLDDVGSGQVELVGKLTELVHRLRESTDALVGVHPVEHWLDALESGIAAITVPTEAWQSGQVSYELGRLRSREGLLRLPDVRAMLRDRLAGRPTRANFRTGTLTVCTMVPMRSVPHRVVVLLGLDDGVFPRVGTIDGDDLLARDPITGERDPRTEDRQLLLDAVLAATETLVITYTGANEVSGQPRPPAVPLGELLDAVEVTAPGARAAVTVHHPLQPFDAGNFLAEAPFSFDRSALAGARAAVQVRTPPPPLLAAPLPTVSGDVSLEELVDFWKSPVRGFFKQRLDVSLARDAEPLEEALPVEISSLDQWAVGQRVLDDLLRGVPADVAMQQEWRRGALPPGMLGWRLLRQIVADAGPLVTQATSLRTRPPTAVDVDIDLGHGRRLRGTVPEVYGDRLVSVGYSRLGARQRLEAWIRLLALTAHDDDHAWSAFTIGRPTNSRSRAGHATSQLGPLDHVAVEHLRDLVTLRDQGLTEPLPLPLKASYAYVGALRTQGSMDEARLKAGWAWEDSKFPGEQSDPEHVRAWGTKAPLPDLTLFAQRVWDPVYVAEQGAH